MAESNALESSRDAAKRVLKKYWGYDSFRAPQDQIIASILEGNDTFALLPGGYFSTYLTDAGSGKIIGKERD
jgi:hypothetical protein